jgi:hypothetical protein
MRYPASIFSAACAAVAALLLAQTAGFAQTAAAAELQTVDLEIGAAGAPANQPAGLIVFVPGSGCAPVRDQMIAFFTGLPGHWRIVAQESLAWMGVCGSAARLPSISQPTMPR